MTRIGPVSIVPTIWLSLAIIVAGLWPAAAQAGCSRWDVSGEWSLNQSNGWNVEVFLAQTGSTLTNRPGKVAARYGLEGEGYHRVFHKVSNGRVSGNTFTFTFDEAAVYTGVIDDGGGMAGTTYVIRNPNETAGWTTGHVAKCGDVTTTPFDSFCNSYANDAVAQATKNKQEKCGLEKENPDRWTLSREAHLNWCLAQEGEYPLPTNEGNFRLNGLKDCAAKQEAMKQKGQLTPGPKISDILKETNPAPTPDQPPATPSAGGMATVIADVDVYKAPGGVGKSIGVLRSNNKTTKVSLVAPCQDNWCHVKGDPVPTGEGWVYSGTPPDFRSLQF